MATVQQSNQDEQSLGIPGNPINQPISGTELREVRRAVRMLSELIMRIQIQSVLFNRIKLLKLDQDIQMYRLI